MLNSKLSIKITHLKTSRQFIELGFGQDLDDDFDRNDYLFYNFLYLKNSIYWNLIRRIGVVNKYDSTLNIGWIEFKDGLTSLVDKYSTLADFVTFLNKIVLFYTVKYIDKNEVVNSMWIEIKLVKEAMNRCTI